MIGYEINRGWFDILSNTPERDDIFVYGGSSNVLKAIVRILLENRLKDGETFVLYYRSFERSSDCDTIMPTENTVLINCPSEDAPLFNGGVAEPYGSFSELSDVNLFAKQYGLFIRVFQNKSTKRTCVCTDKSSPIMQVESLIAAMFPRLFPWFFEENPLSDQERELLNLVLTAKSRSGFIDEINAYTNTYLDLRSSRLALVKDFESNLRELSVSKRNEDLMSVDASIEDVLERYRSLLIQKRDLENEIAGMKMRFSEGVDDEVFDYFRKNKQLEVLCSDNSSLQFEVITPLSLFDPDAAESLIENHSSYWYTHGMVEEMERILRAIFVEEKLKLFVSAQYLLDFGNTKLRGLPERRTPRAGRLSIPNMHIYKYSCLGDNAAQIMKAVSDMDVIRAVTGCCMSAQNFNVLDSAVGNGFATFIAHELKSSRGASCIELPDGRRVTIKTALRWLGTEEGELT